MKEAKWRLGHSQLWNTRGGFAKWFKNEAAVFLLNQPSTPWVPARQQDPEVAKVPMGANPFSAPQLFATGDDDLVGL